jgi:hypothetical protein
VAKPGIELPRIVSAACSTAAPAAREFAESDFTPGAVVCAMIGA